MTYDHGKLYFVRLTASQRKTLQTVIKKRIGSKWQIRRARILLKTDVNGPAWTDDRIAEAFGCSNVTVANIRRRLINEGFKAALHGHKFIPPSIFNEKQAARLVSMWRGKPPRGHSNWSLRLLAKRAVQLGIADAVSHETIRKTLMKNSYGKAR